MDIQALRQERAKLYSDFESISAAAETEARELTEEEDATFSGLEARIKTLDGRIRTAERQQSLRAATAIPAPSSGTPADPEDPDDVRVRVHAEPRERPEPGIRFAQITRALIVGRGNPESAAAFAMQTWGERHEITAALQQNDFESGGALVPERFTAELIDLLEPRTVIRRNTMTVPLIGGTDNMPTIEEGIAGYYLGEGDDIQSDEPRFGGIKFVERELAVLVPISNKLLRNASINVDATVRNLLVRGFALTEDRHFLRGTGTGPGPKGIRHLVPAAHVIPATGGTTPTVAQIDADARKAEMALLGSDVLMTNVRWLMNPRESTFLRDLRDANGNLVYPGLSQPTPTWKGFPVEVTNQIPRNLGGTEDESEIYLVDFDLCLIADSYQVRIDASENAAYRSGEEMVSAFSRNQTVIRALAGHDFGMTQKVGAAVLSGIRWGAG